LTYAWTSHRILDPSAPVIANGVVYVLSAGSSGANAILYAFEAVSGKELYSSGQQVNSFARSSGLAVANGHVCFGTSDNTLYCFGLPIDL
jgi:outer membrane protein assembly factor BamB